MNYIPITLYDYTDTAIYICITMRYAYMNSSATKNTNSSAALRAHTTSYRIFVLKFNTR